MQPEQVKVEVTTYSLIEKIESDALIIHCSDPRFQRAFAQFVNEELGVCNPTNIVLPGSIGSFGVQGFLPKRWNALKSHIELMTKNHAYSRVILINHDDCKGYADIAKFVGGLARGNDAQRIHLQKLARFVTDRYLPNARVELYQAKIVGGENDSRRVRFEKVLEA